MTIAEILRKAAIRVDSGKDEFACHAIDHAEGCPHWLPGPAGRWFQSCQVRPRSGSSAWWSGPTSRQDRVIGLLLAAEIAESETIAMSEKRIQASLPVTQRKNTEDPKAFRMEAL